VGKQAKKKTKSDSVLSKQKRHNPSTRGMNTKKRGALWAIRSYKVKDEDGNEEERTYRIHVPPRTLYDPFDKGRYSDKASEPFDALSLDWRHELQQWACEIGAKVGNIKLPDGRYRYVVYSGEIVHLVVESSAQFSMSRPRRRRRRKARKA